MCALSHYIERGGGVATTGISLIREHAEGMRPPRSLWVPFPLGLPLGAPNDAAFQTEVVNAALGLLESATEQTIADFDRDAPPPAGTEQWACPVALAAPEPADDADALLQKLTGEIRALQPWHDEWRSSRGRTSVGGSGVGADGIEQMAALIARNAFADHDAGGGWAHPMPVRLKYVADDMRAWYFEAASAKPGSAPDDAALNRWLFGETTLGEALQLVVERLSASDDRARKGAVASVIPGGFRRKR